MHLFFQPDPGTFELDEEEARHSTKVLRLTSGEVIYVTDGKGMLARCILNVQGRRVGYEIVEKVVQPRRPYRVNMGIAPTRKAERNEWMVEKMTEMGVDRIDFLITEHTHQETMNRVVNLTRLTRIAVAAMKQSQQFYMPEITVNNQLDTFIKSRTEAVRLIAYVPGHDTVPHVFSKVKQHSDTSLLIGPEGDFTPEEVSLALDHGFETVSLGPTRLRTETAAVSGCHAINLAQFLG
ncbi:RsmE family RNA methyltransferase [Dyadobacter sandarakinus]|uniref:Ribosomal RNA small subunit methyltransferase E n=1 Tax=Dyadobacter sandarakinus TaxID=2747268 RepID=A0ABX7I1M9_9BACT|nr:RsmE family RNA methyltransferase [Dyadobacter sandarakinus]QRQ99985.1 16S rRNA (uracil(1498)-N(3))-methyltransferase [Dyadobacter sandarakinus]